MDPGNEQRYRAEMLRCYACAAKDREIQGIQDEHRRAAKDNRPPNVDTAGLRVAVAEVS